MKKTFKASSTFGIFIAVIMILLACDKEFNSIDSDVLGEENLNFFTDKYALDVLAYNKKLDAAQVNGLSSNLLGVYFDDLYGQTEASIVAQILPSQYNPDFGINPVIDSVMLNIPYFSRAVSVDANGNQEYEMNERDSLYVFGDGQINLSIYRSNYFLRSTNPNNTNEPEPQNYYSFAENTPDNTANYILTESGAVNFDDPSLLGDLIYDDIYEPSSEPIEITSDETTVFSPPALRIPLDIPFWKATIFDKQGSSELSNANNFRNYFRGLYIKAQAKNSTDGHMQLLNLAGTNANITIYYSSESETNASERTQSTYVFNFSGIRLNTFINNFTPPLEDGNPTNGDEKLHLKGMAGSMAVVELFQEDDLNALRDLFVDNSNPENPVQLRLINDAILIVYEDGNLTDEEHKFDRLYAYDIKNNTPIIDYNFDPSTNTNVPFNSKFIHLGQRDTISDASGNSARGYKIRITEHIKRILINDSTNTKVGLVISNNVNNINNSKLLNSTNGITNVPSATMLTPRGSVIFGNNTNSGKKMRLEIYYTEPTN